jgi:cytochrome c553
MAQEEELYLDADRLVYWSHWITPSVEPKRFDTRFFAIAVPPGQAVSADLSELTHHAWVRPARASEAIERGEIRVVPPTLLTLEDLAESYARHGSLDAMLAAERGRAVYREHCEGCHGPRGEGARGAYAALAGTRVHFRDRRTQRLILPDWIRRQTVRSSTASSTAIRAASSGSTARARLSRRADSFRTRKSSSAVLRTGLLRRWAGNPAMTWTP